MIPRHRIVYQGNAVACDQFLPYALNLLFHAYKTSQRVTMKRFGNASLIRVMLEKDGVSTVYIEAGKEYHPFVNVSGFTGEIVPLTAFYGTHQLNPLTNSLADLSAFFTTRFPTDKLELLLDMDFSAQTYNDDLFMAAELYNPSLPTDATNNLKRTPTEVICTTFNVSDTGDIVSFTGSQTPYGYRFSAPWPPEQGFVSYLGKKYYTSVGGVVMDAIVYKGKLYVLSGNSGRFGFIRFEVIDTFAALGDGNDTFVSLIDVTVTDTQVDVGGTVYTYDGGAGDAFLMCAKIHPEATELSLLIDNTVSTVQVGASSRQTHNFLDITVPFSIDKDLGVAESLFIVIGDSSATNYPGERAEIVRTTTPNYTVYSTSDIVETSTGWYGRVNADYFNNTVFIRTSAFDYDQSTISSIPSSLTLEANLNPGGWTEIEDGGTYVHTTITPTDRVKFVFNAPIVSGDTISDFTIDIFFFNHDESIPSTPNGTANLRLGQNNITLTSQRKQGTYTVSRSAASPNNSIKIGFEYIRDRNLIDFGARKWLTFEVGSGSLGYQETFDFNFLLDIQFDETLIDHPSLPGHHSEIKALVENKPYTSVGELLGTAFPVDLTPKIYFDGDLIGAAGGGYYHKLKTSYFAKYELLRSVGDYSKIMFLTSVKAYKDSDDITTSGSYPNIVMDEPVFWPHGDLTKTPGSIYPLNGFSNYCLDALQIFDYTSFDATPTTAESAAGLITKKIFTQTEKLVNANYIFTNGIRKIASAYPKQKGSVTTMDVLSTGLDKNKESNVSLKRYVDMEIADTETTIYESLAPWNNGACQGFRYELEPGFFIVGTFSYISNTLFNGDSLAKRNELWIEDIDGIKLLDINECLTPSGLVDINFGVNIDTQEVRKLIMGVAN